MRCPFCDEDVSSAAALCSSCRELLPSQNLFEIYRIEISKDRSLVLKENRAALDSRAQEQFDTRSRLLKEARERQAEAEENRRQLDRENALIEKNLREAEELLNRQVRQRRLRWAAKFIVLPTILVMICVSSWFVYRHLTENAAHNRATAAHNRAVISRCPAGPTLTILEQTYKNISDSQILDKNQMRDLNAARYRLSTFLSGKPTDPANMALSNLYFRLGMVHEGYRISPSLMQEIRVNIDSALSLIDPKSCQNTRMLSTTRSNASSLVSTDASRTSDSVSAPIGQVTSTTKVTKKAETKTSKNSVSIRSKASVLVSGQATASTRQIPYLYGLSRYFYCTEFDCNQEAGWIICANLVDDDQPDNFAGQNKYIGLVSSINAQLRPSQLYGSETTPEPVLLSTSHKWLDDVTSPNDKLKLGQQFCGRFKNTRAWGGNIVLTWTFSNGFVSTQIYEYNLLGKDDYWERPHNTGSIQGWPGASIMS